MPAKVCALQMHSAYGHRIGQAWNPLTLGQAKDVDLRMLG